MIPVLGQRFGPFEILGRVGAGGMGLVLRAWDERLHREVAIKLLYDSYQMPGTRERFLQEARAASKLSHPNICTVFDIGEKDGDPYLVMELLEGETLKDKLARGALPAEEIVAYAKDVTEALAAAHAKEIVHRDIKPANIFLVNLPVGGTQAKVLDFGLAKIGLSEGGGWMSRSLDLTLAGATVGTLAYMSPEQACGQELDARSDLFSLGIVMYEMATRRIPFRGTTSALIYTQLLEHDPDPIRKWNDSIPKDLERLILKLLAKNRKERFQSAKELLSALAKIESKLHRNGWFLKKNSNSAVPLVPLIEPVAAQRRRPVRSIGRMKDNDAEVHASSDSGQRSSGENVLIRPFRISAQRGVQERSISAFKSNQCAVAVESGPQPTEFSAAVHESAASKHDFEAPSIIALRGSHERAPELPAREEKQPWKRTTLTAAAIIMVAVVPLLLFVYGDLHPILRSGDSLLLASLQNKAEDAELEGAVLEGLEIDLNQSPYIKALGAAASQAGLRSLEASGDRNATAQTIAQRVGAKAYLYGEVRREGSTYVLHVDVLDTQSNDKLASISETVESRQQIPDAVDRLSRTLRAEVGERKRSIAETSLSLESAASANVDALNAYFSAEKAMTSGRVSEGLAMYERAVKSDPKFGLAWMKLTWLYQEEGAEIESARAAQAAEDALRSAEDKEKWLAEFCRAMNVNNDYVRALTIMRDFGHRFPGAPEGLIGLARVLRVQGHMVEALLAAQQAYGNSPYNLDAYSEAELALIGLDRYNDALALEEQANKLGISANKYNLTAAFLGNNQEALPRQLKLIPESSISPQLSTGISVQYARYLDNSGQLSIGAAVWRQAAEETKKAEGTTSASASLLAQGALNNAIAGNCRDAKELARKSQAQFHGLEALFHSGMANSLCGDKVGIAQAIAEMQTFPHNTLAAQYYLPVMQASQMFLAGETVQALELLTRDETRVSEPLTLYLRATVEAALGQQQQAIEDFRNISEHRGIAFLQGGNIYPFAESALSRALTTTDRPAETAEPSRRFSARSSKPANGRPLIAAASRIN